MRYNTRTHRRVAKLTPQGVVVRVYESVPIAAELHGFGAKALYRHLSGLTSSFAGHQWEYVIEHDRYATEGG